MATYTINRNEFLATALERPGKISVGNRGQTTFKSDLQEIWEGVQGDRAVMLGQVRLLQLAVQLLMQGESLRLGALAPDDDRVALLAAAASRAGDRIAMLDEEISVADVRVPMVKKTEALLNGRITGDAAEGVGAVTVTLADEHGVAIPGVPPVESDSGGYYAIVVPAAAAAELGPNRKLQVVLGHGNERVTTAAAVQLQPGAVAVNDIGLSASMLDKLKLRLTTVVAPRAAARAGRGHAAKSANAKSSGRKPARKGGGKRTAR